MDGRGRRRKGHDFERWLVRRLKESGLFADVQRGFQARGGQEQPDVAADELWIECKRGKRPNITAALRQATDDSPISYTPAAVTKADRAPALITMTLDNLLELLEVRG